MTRQAMLDDLALANRPQQFGLLERTADVLSQSPVVRHLSVRGSLAAGTADRMSDIDFVVGVRDAAFQSFVHVLDAVMEAELGAILPGWRDTIVGTMGGLGYVYLVAFEGKLQQIDLYVAPTSLVADIQRRTKSHILYAPSHSDADSLPADDADINQLVEQAAAARASCSDLLVEILVLVQMIRKRIIRGQHFLVYAETHVLLAAVKNLIKEALAPTSASWGWYHLDEDVGVTPIGRDCLGHLSALVSGRPLRTQDELRWAVDRIFRIVRRATPGTIESVEPAIEAYRHYLELA